MPKKSYTVAQLGKQNAAGESLAYEIAKAGNVKDIAHLLTRGLIKQKQNPDIKDTVLLLLARTGKIRHVAGLIERDDLFKDNFTGHPAIFWILDSGTIGDVKRLLDENILLKEDDNHWNYAHYAAVRGGLRGLINDGDQKLLTERVLGAKNVNGNNVAHLAAKNGTLGEIASIVTLPIVEAENERGKTPVDIALETDADLFKRTEFSNKEVQAVVLGKLLAV
jgi:hypothetical protein